MNELLRLQKLEIPSNNTETIEASCTSCGSGSCNSEPSETRA